MKEGATGGIGSGSGGAAPRLALTHKGFCRFPDRIAARSPPRPLGRLFQRRFVRRKLIHLEIGLSFRVDGRTDGRTDGLDTRRASERASEMDVTTDNCRRHLRCRSILGRKKGTAFLGEER